MVLGSGGRRPRSAVGGSGTWAAKLFSWDQTLLVTAEVVEGRVTGATVAGMMIRMLCGIRMLRSIDSELHTLHPFLVSANEKTETSHLSMSGIRGSERLTC